MPDPAPNVLQIDIGDAQRILTWLTTRPLVFQEVRPLVAILEGGKAVYVEPPETAEDAALRELRDQIGDVADAVKDDEPG